MRLTALVTASLAFTALGCLGDPIADDLANVTEQRQSALGEASCANHPQDGSDDSDFVAIWPSFPPCTASGRCMHQPMDWTTPRTYTRANCVKSVKAHIVRPTGNYGPGDQPGGIYVTYADTLPTTQAACQALYLRADLYETGTSPTGNNRLLSTKTARGVWSAVGPFVPVCFGPQVFFSSEVPADKYFHGYTVMAGARTSSSSAAATRKIRIQERRPVIIR